MNIKELKQDGLSHEYEITIPANDIDAHVETKLKEVGKTYKVPGFRPGKVPMKILRQKLGRAVMGEVLETAVNETSQKALSDKKLKPAMQPKIEVKSFDEGKDLVYSMAFEVIPEIKLADFKKQTFTKPTAKPSDKDIQDALEKIAANNTQTKAIEGNRGAKDGDTLLIDFHGRTADDNKEHEGMHAHGHRLKLGSNSFIPGFEEQLLKAKAGDKVEVKVSFPKEYHAEELAGRDAIFDVNVHEIHEDTDAEINDEFAQTLGLDDLTALKKAIEEQLQKEFDSVSKTLIKKDVLDFIDEKHQFDAPPTMLELEYKNIEDQLKLEKQRQGEDKPELSKDEEKEYKQIADRRVRLGLVLAQIGQDQSLSIADQELQSAVIKEAQKFPGQEQHVFDYYAKNPQALDSLRAPLYEEKVIDYILELSTVNEKEISAEKLQALLEEENEDEAPKKKKAAEKKSDTKGETKKAPAKKKTTSKTTTKKSADKKD